MSYNYLLDISRHIDARITSLTAGTTKAAAAPAERYRTEGRLDALNGFQALLCRDYYPKLPQRLFRQLSATACEAPSPRKRENITEPTSDV